MTRLLEKIHVNIPFKMLNQSYLDRFVKHRLNPEIGLDAESLDRYSFSDFERIADQLHECGLATTLHAPFVDLAPGSPDPMVRAVARKRFEQALGLIRVFRAKTVVCHAGYDWKRYWYIRDVWIEKSLEMWSWLGQGVRDAGALLMLENVYETNPEDIGVLFEKLGSQGVGFCLDTGHQAVFSKAPLGKWVESLRPYIGQLHLHDNSGIKDDHLAPGQGRVDFQALFTQLIAYMKDPPVITLEPHKEQDLWPGLKYLEKIWPW